VNHGLEGVILGIIIGIIIGIRQDKDQLQKQFELVTLRLPAPKKSLWDWIRRW
jgi:type III secretory pathway component EscS